MTSYFSRPETRKPTENVAAEYEEVAGTESKNG